MKGLLRELQAEESAPALTEFDLGYYGWRVALAACLGVMAGFGSLFVYTFAVFVKPLSAEFGWNREAISLGFGLAAVTLGLISPLLGRWIDRFGPRRIILPCMTVYCCAILSLAFLHSHSVAVLRNLRRAGFGRKRCSALGLFAIDFHVVSATFGDGTRFRNGGSGLGRYDPAGCSAEYYRPSRLESSLLFPRLSCLTAWAATQLAFCPRARPGQA